MTREEIQRQRAAVVAAAVTWIGTPFHHSAAVKGAGCDCSHLGMAFNEALGVNIVWPRVYITNPQWFMHADPKSGEFKELYLDGLRDNGFVELSDGQPNFEPFHKDNWIDEPKQTGDALVAKLGRMFAHGAVIEDWPQVIQAEPTPMGRGIVCRANVEANWFLSCREIRFYSWKGWH